MRCVNVEFAVGDVATLSDCLRRGQTPSPRAVQRSARRSLRSSAAASHCIIRSYAA